MKIKLFLPLFLFVLLIGNGLAANFTIDGYTPSNLNVSITEPSNQLFTVDIGDPDGDVNVTWYLDDATMATGSQYNYVGSFASAGTYTVLMEAVDNETNQNVTWNLTVVDNSIDWGLVSALLVMALLGGVVILFYLLRDILMTQEHPISKSFRSIFVLILPLVLIGIARFGSVISEASGSVSIISLFDFIYKFSIALSVMVYIGLILLLLYQFVMEGKRKAEEVWR